MRRLQLAVILYLANAHCSVAIKLGKLCLKSNGNFSLTATVDLKGDVLEYITFLDNAQNELKTACSTSTAVADAPSEFTGSGTTADPYVITIVVDTTVNISSGDPDCGHSTSGNLLTWTMRVVHTTSPFTGTIGRQVDVPFECDFDTVTDNPSTGVAVNGTAEITDFKTVVLTHTSLALEMTIIKDTLTEYGPTEPYNLGDLVRLRIRAINNITGLYGFDCKACNTATCNDLVFPILDSQGCKTANFISTLGPATSSVAESNLGTFMLGHIVVPGLNFAQYAGMAFTEEFSLFRFINSRDLFFSCGIGYCEDPTDVYCTEHCRQALGIGRKKREISPDSDRMLAVVTVQGVDESLMIDYPRKGKQVMETPSMRAKDCLEKPEYAGVMAGLGTLLLGTSLLAMILGIKVSRMRY